ncbi:DUF4307 domain-containing protein [Prauserella flavalba]|uniref:DUF4307 domain-containing protein n=1 Tax=Prauserella flavalba TaxID=1477506 RepID=A0A318LRE1_9PSEU|nr:DUF4307 domain-containing protein [Prauserella flavalba]PXY33713.1 hypothetical protein BA062_15815 [Prauserella flavalba]
MSTGQATSATGSGRPALPEGRYGSARPSGRAPRGWQKWLFGALVLLIGGGAAYIGYSNIGSAPIEAQRVGFAERPGNAMEITIDVARDDTQRPGVCIVRVRDISGAESGRKEIYVPPGEERLSTVVRSITRPVTADVYGCSYNVPEYLSSP